MVVWVLKVCGFMSSVLVEEGTDWEALCVVVVWEDMGFGSVWEGCEKGVERLAWNCVSRERRDAR